MVSGVTSAISVPAAAGIPATHRGLAKGFSVVTGHEELSEVPARADHTIVLLDGRRPTPRFRLRPWPAPVCQPGRLLVS